MSGGSPIATIEFLLSPSGDAPFEIGRLESTHPLRTSVKPHRHDFYQVLWAIEGAVTHTLDFERYLLEAGQIMLIAPGQVHTVRVDRPLAGYMLLFTEDFLSTPDWEAVRALLGQSMFPFSRSEQRGNGCPVLRPREDEALRLKRTAEDLLHELGGTALWRAAMVRAHFQVFLILLCRLAVRQLPAAVQKPSLVTRFQQLVEEHFRQTTRVSSYSDMLAVTPGYLNEVVKRVNGVTASEVIDARVLLEAKRLLAHSDHTVAEIAVQLGFDDPSYFGRFFRRHAHRSPAAFRASIRETYQGNR